MATVYIVLLNDRPMHVCESPSTARTRLAALRAKRRGPWSDRTEGSLPKWRNEDSGDNIWVEAWELEQ